MLNSRAPGCKCSGCALECDRDPFLNVVEINRLGHVYFPSNPGKKKASNVAIPATLPAKPPKSKYGFNTKNVSGRVVIKRYLIRASITLLILILAYSAFRGMGKNKGKAKEVSSLPKQQQFVPPNYSVPPSQQQMFTSAPINAQGAAAAMVAHQYITQDPSYAYYYTHGYNQYQTENGDPWSMGNPDASEAEYQRVVSMFNNYLGEQGMAPATTMPTTPFHAGRNPPTGYGHTTSTPTMSTQERVAIAYDKLERARTSLQLLTGMPSPRPSTEKGPTPPAVRGGMQRLTGTAPPRPSTRTGPAQTSTRSGPAQISTRSGPAQTSTRSGPAQMGTRQGQMGTRPGQMGTRPGPTQMSTRTGPAQVNTRPGPTLPGVGGGTQRARNATPRRRGSVLQTQKGAPGKVGRGWEGRR